MFFSYCSANILHIIISSKEIIFVFPNIYKKIDLYQGKMYRPSELMGIELKWNNFIPFGSYITITFFGRMWIKNSKKNKWNEYVETGYDKVVTHHEMIHVKQAVSTKNSWLRFYWLYIWYWIKLLFTFNGSKFAYKMNPFELEAYANEEVPDYVDVYSNGAVRWKTYREIPVKQLKTYYKEYRKKAFTMTFSKYVREYIDKDIDFSDKK